VLPGPLCNEPILSIVSGDCGGDHFGWAQSAILPLSCRLLSARLPSLMLRVRSSDI